MCVELGEIWGQWGQWGKQRLLLTRTFLDKFSYDLLLAYRGWFQLASFADYKQLKQCAFGALLVRLFHKKGKGVPVEQVVTGEGRRGAKGGTVSRSREVSGFHKTGLSQLNDSDMTFQVQKRLFNKHSNRGLVSVQ